jgi:hypothetical protein
VAVSALIHLCSSVLIGIYKRGVYRRRESKENTTGAETARLLHAAGADTHAKVRMRVCGNRSHPAWASSWLRWPFPFALVLRCPVRVSC